MQNIAKIYLQNSYTNLSRPVLGNQAQEGGEDMVKGSAAIPALPGTYPPPCPHPLFLPLSTLSQLPFLLPLLFHQPTETFFLQRVQAFDLRILASTLVLTLPVEA